MIDKLIQKYRNFEITQRDITSAESSFRKVQMNGETKTQPNAVGLVFKERNNAETEVYVPIISIEEVQLNKNDFIENINTYIESCIDSYILTNKNRILKGYCSVLHHVQDKKYFGCAVSVKKPYLIVGKTYRKF